jgi:hypothetical protein
MASLVGRRMASANGLALGPADAQSRDRLTLHTYVEAATSAGFELVEKIDVRK